jgi:ribosome-binding protein aMBF1 (putative translation factor)
MTTDAPPTWALNPLRRHIARWRPRAVDDAEILQFCRTRTDDELLAIRSFGAKALRAVRAWSGPPEEVIAGRVSEAGPNTRPTTPPAEPEPSSQPPELVWLPRLRTVREARGLSVPELARASGLPVGVIAVIDRLDRRASPSTVRKLAQALGVEPGELVEASSREHRAEAELPLAVSRGEK